MEANRIRKGLVVECQQGVGTILVVDQEAETVLLAKQGSEEQLAVSFDEIEDNPQLHGNCDKYYQFEYPSIKKIKDKINETIQIRVIQLKRI